jgi:hypothetical protein
MQRQEDGREKRKPEKGDVSHMHGVARRRHRMIARSLRIASKFLGACRDEIFIFGDAEGVLVQ